ncbi:Tudor domain-containing protein 10 [Manis javanica]|nr:Tudor domain-containing protein 10 [Manis javanica]
MWLVGFAGYPIGKKLKYVLEQQQWPTFSDRLFGKNGALEEQKSPGIKKTDTRCMLRTFRFRVCVSHWLVVRLTASLGIALGFPVSAPHVLHLCGCSPQPSPHPLCTWGLGLSPEVLRALAAGATEEVQYLLKDLNPLRVYKIQDRCKWPQELPETPTQEEKEVLMAGVLFLWRRDGVRPEQVLEKPSDQGIARTTDETLGCHVLPGPYIFQQTLPAARGWFLVLLLRECFRDLHGWPPSVTLAGRWGCRCPHCPQMPFFWAMHVTETLHQNTQVLSSRALADQRSSNPTCVTLPCGVGPTVWPSTTWGIMGRPGTDVCLGSRSQIEKPPRVPHELAQPGRCRSRPCRGWRWGARLRGKTPRLKVLKGTGNWTRRWILSELVQRILQKLVHLYVRTHLNGAA